MIGGGAAMLAVRLLRIDRRLVLGHPGRRPVRGAAGDVFAAPVGLSGAGGAGGADRGDHRLGVAANAVCDAGRHRLTQAVRRHIGGSDRTPLRPKTLLDLRSGKDRQHRMNLQPDDKSPNAPVAAPRGWLRATIVAALAIVFVGAAVGFVGFLVAIARRRNQARPQRRRHRGADRRFVARLRRDGIAGRPAMASGF